MKISDITVAPGRYVLAVSGGVDSMVLLNVLTRQPDIRLTVAHLDHGIRNDSAEDRRLVQAAAKFYSLSFVYHEANLGIQTSEATAREERYKFLETVREFTQAQAVITAHHQDDMLETAILNMLRGTDRRGLSALSENYSLVRPLLSVPKTEVINYALERDLVWHEDSTNSNNNYLRNHIRHQILARFDDQARAKLLKIINQSKEVNLALDQELIHQLHYQPQANKLHRHWFISLPHVVAREVMATWLREHQFGNFDRPMLERLTVQAKTLAPGQQINIYKNAWLIVGSEILALTVQER